MTIELLTPMYVSNTIEHEGKKLKMFIVELPSNEIINMLDLTGVFIQSVVSQVYEIIRDIVENKDDTLKIKYDFDGILLSFIKHYKGTTQTIVLSSDEEIVSKYNDFNLTNVLIKNCLINRKYNLKGIIEGTTIFFNLDGIDDKLADWEELKNIF